MSTACEPGCLGRTRRQTIEQANYLKYTKPTSPKAAAKPNTGAELSHKKAARASEKKKEQAKRKWPAPEEVEWPDLDQELVLKFLDEADDWANTQKDAAFCPCLTAN
ncbi:hypothetical protein WJX72_006912 [[Myrmecia] bisecta]|uniref:Uncharacterized protein n=1 Tax=[Myrmecia] bisecta TaxID=41462 RepID=A0AAW1R7U8_9CHLO